MGVARNLPLAARLTRSLHLAPRWRPVTNGLQRETPRGARVRLVRRKGRDVSAWYGGKDETCPLGTGGRTRRVQLAQGEGGGGARRLLEAHLGAVAVPAIAERRLPVREPLRGAGGVASN